MTTRPFDYIEIVKTKVKYNYYFDFNFDYN